MPYGMDVSPDDIPALAELYGCRVSVFDPETETFTDYEALVEPPCVTRRLGFDSKGILWYGVYSQGKLGKINLETGEITWTAAAGISPYGASLNADESEIWVANKGETTGHFGRTVSVLKASTGQQLATLFSGYEVDHILLSPNGKEMWATSNGEGNIHVFDTATREKKTVIQMPQNGDPHGLVWVHYDENGDARVVRDQGGFRNGINPAKGVALDY